jgi:hypothetical protein
MVADASPSGFRISLREALLAFAAASVGFAALVYANSWWLATVNTVALVAIVAAIIVAMLGRGSGRAFAVGFCVASVTYLVVAFAMEQHQNQMARLLSTKALDLVYEQIRREAYVNEQTGAEFSAAVYKAEIERLRTRMPGGSRPNTSIVTAQRTVQPYIRDFRSVGMQLWALLLGYAGGCFGRFVHARSRHN